MPLRTSLLSGKSLKFCTCIRFCSYHSTTHAGTCQLAQNMNMFDVTAHQSQRCHIRVSQLFDKKVYWKLVNEISDLLRYLSTCVVVRASWSIPGSRLDDPRLAWMEPRHLLHSRYIWSCAFRVDHGRSCAFLYNPYISLLIRNWIFRILYRYSRYLRLRNKPSY